MADNIFKNSPFSAMSETSTGKAVSAAGLRFYLLLLACLALFITCIGFLVFHRLQQNETRSIEQNLAAIANLKVNEINRWNEQNRTNAIISSRASSVADHARLWLAAGAGAGAEQDWLRARLEALLQIHSYGEITILDVSGNVLLTTDKLPPDVSDLQPLMRAAMAQNQPVVGNMRWDTRKDGSAKYISVPIAAPLIASGENKRIVGILLIMADANQFLFPLIQSWPTPSETAETQLLRRDGDEVLFLNELRNKKDTALRLRIPADNPTVLAAQAARGASGFISGTDYRGEPVIGYASRVPGTDWLMIAKIDADEVYAPIRYVAAVIATAIFALLLVVSIILFLWWRNRNAQYQSSHLQAELDQQLLSQQFDYLTRYANDIILLLDESGNIVEANERAETSYGLSRQELLGRNIRDLHAPADRESFDQHWDEIKRNKRLLYEGSYIRNDGSQFPAEVNSRLIETEKGVFVQKIIRDITERKAAQARVLRLTNIYRALGETNKAIIHLDSEAGLFPLVCRIAVEYGGMMHAWVGIPDAGNRFVPVASHGKAPAYLENIFISAAGDAPEGKGPTGIAFWEGIYPERRDAHTGNGCRSHAERQLFRRRRLCHGYHRAQEIGSGGKAGGAGISGQQRGDDGHRCRQKYHCSQPGVRTHNRLQE